MPQKNENETPHSMQAREPSLFQKIGERWKAIVGLALLSLAALAFFRNVVLVNTQDAFVNAYLSPLRSPIAGSIQAPLPAPGTRTTNADRVRVVNARPDETLLIETTERLAAVNARLLEARAGVARLEESEAEFSEWAERFRASRDHFLRERERELRAQLEARREQQSDAQDALDRLENHARYVPARQITEARTRLDVASENLEAAHAQLRQLGAEREALAERIQVADTFSERTFSDQKVQETRLRARLLQAGISSLEEQKSALEESVAAARRQLERERAAELSLPDAIVWRREPAEAHVAASGSLGSLALCSDLLVTATLDRRAFERVQVGDEAQVRMRGDDGESVTTNARVITLTGAAMENILGMAIPFGRATLEDAYGAVLRLNSPQKLDCAVGSSVSLRFLGR